MAFTRYHNVTGSTGVDVELLAPGSGANDIKSIMITNVHASADATVTLFLYQASSASTYNIIHTVAIPADTSLLLDDSALLSFTNSASGYGLYTTVGSSDTVDILINI
jgi:hypothetical protein